MLGDFSGWPSHSTTDVQDSHALFDTDGLGQVLLMSGYRSLKLFPGVEAAEMKGLAPCELKEIGR
jgi:hypothetical protein